MRKRGICCGPVSVRPSVCPSVRLSVCPSFVHSIQTAEDIIKLLYRPGSPIILVFGIRRRYPVPRVTPSARVQNTRGGKILRFSTETAVSLGNGTRYAHGCYGMLIGSHMRSIEWWHFQWPWRILNSVFKVTVYCKSNISKTIFKKPSKKS